MVRYPGAHINVVDQNNRTPLSYAVLHGRNDIFSYLVNIGAPNVLDCDNNTLMHLAAYTNQASTIRLLSSSGHPVDIINLQGRTPLHIAAYFGHANATRELLAQGATPRITDNNGQRPLQIAVAQGHTDVAMQLINHQLLPILVALGDIDVLRQRVETTAINSLTGNRVNIIANAEDVYKPFILADQRDQNLQRFCRNMRRYAGLLNQSSQGAQARELSLLLNTQLLAPELQHQLIEQHQQLQTLMERLQQIHQCLQNDLQQIRKNAQQ